MASIAYGLRADYQGTVDTDDGPSPVFLGGVITLGDRDLDVAQALEAGAGVIVVEDTDFQAVAALDAYPALKREAGHAGDAPTVSPYAGRTVAQLRADLRSVGLDASGDRETLEARLQAHATAVAAGDQSAADNPTPESAPAGDDTATPEA